MDQAAGDPDALDVPIIAVPNPLIDALLPRLPAEDVDGPDGGGVDGGVGDADAVGRVEREITQVDLLDVPPHARVEATKAAVEAYTASAHDGGQPQGLGDTDVPGLVAAVHEAEVAADQAALAHGIKHVARVAAADVGAEADVDARVEQGAHGAEAAAQGAV